MIPSGSTNYQQVFQNGSTSWESLSVMDGSAISHWQHTDLALAKTNVHGPRIQNEKIISFLGVMDISGWSENHDHEDILVCWKVKVNNF